jgi:hypothetical protein
LSGKFRFAFYRRKNGGFIGRPVVRQPDLKNRHGPAHVKLGKTMEKEK